MSRSEKQNQKIRVDFLLPIKTLGSNDEWSIPSIFTKIEELAKEHGGATISPMTIGLWIHPTTGKQVTDVNVSFYVIMKKDERGSIFTYLRDQLKPKLVSQFGEEVIYITWQDVHEV